MVGNAFDLTGAPLHQIEVLEGLDSHHIHTTWAHANSPGALSERLHQFGVPSVTTGHPLADVQTLPQYEMAVRVFADQLVRSGAEVVCANTLEAFYAVDAARHAHLPAVWNIHESESWQAYFERFGSPIAQRALTCFSHPYQVIFTSDATMRVHSGHNTHNNFTLIRSGLDNRRVPPYSAASRADSRRAFGATPGDIVLLLVGTVCARKAQMDLVSAIARMPEASVTRTRCVFVGDRPNPYSEQLHERIRSLPATRRERVTVVAETAEVARYYQAADVFICTSLVECFPRVILEAMAHGLPIISTDVFGIPEQVIDGVNGVLFTPGDVAALARHIDEFIVNEPRRRQMAARSADALACLPSFDEMLGRYAEIVHEAKSLR
jgi:glycosyltransferase involved in cell wall biosynthesis